jgi:outer membrane protein assembly factor BamB
MRVRLYFFPALLPIAEALPWLLTAFGALAGFLLSATRGRAGLLRLAAILLALVVLALAGRYAGSRIWWLREGDSRLSLPSELPRRMQFGTLPVEMPAALRRYRPGEWHLAWTIRPGRRALSNPLQAGGAYLVGTWESTVEAYALANGAPLWRLQKKEPVYAMSVASPSLLLAGEGLHESGAAALTAVRLPEGTPLWQREFRGHIESAPTYSEKFAAVWVGSGPAGLWSLNARNGSVNWHARVGHVDSTPLLAPGDLLLLSSQPNESVKESTLWALRPADGSVSWSLALPGQPWGSPQLDSATGLVLVSTGVGQIGVKRADDRGWAHAVSLVERKIAWSADLGGNPIEKSILARGLAIYVLTKGEVVALHIADGKEAWRLPLGGEVQADPTLGPEGVVAVTSTTGKVSLIDLKAGKLLETRSFEAGTGAAPLFLSDGVLVTTPYTHTRFRW